jgi:DNA-binding Lrp family transcriptional regulator
MSDLEQKILAALQGGLPASRTPYQDLARHVGIETDELLDVLADWKKDGKLRRIGGIVNHFKMGSGAGAMVVWKVEPNRVEAVGKMLAGFAKVSHAYERQTNEYWRYNVYTMVHAGSAEELATTIQRMSKTCDVTEYRVLATERELKKAPPTYITK